MPPTRDHYEHLRRSGAYRRWARQVLTGADAPGLPAITNVHPTQPLAAAMPVDRQREYDYLMTVGTWLDGRKKLRLKTGFSAPTYDLMALATYEWMLLDHLYPWLPGKHAGWLALPRTKSQKSELSRQLVKRGSLMQSALIPGTGSPRPDTGDAYLLQHLPQLVTSIVDLVGHVRSRPGGAASGQDDHVERFLERMPLR